MTSFRWGAAGDVGQVRQVNQDHILATDGLFAVADGMGGHRGGEVASEVAIDALQEHFGRPTTECLVEAVQLANEAVVTRAAGDSELRGMGTTMCALARVVVDGEEGLTVVNVGDSRAYLLMDGTDRLVQISEDHSLVATLERQGQITKEDAAVHPQRNILTRALGIDQRVLVDSFDLAPVVGDRYLLCSDGLFNEVEEPRICQVLGGTDDPQAAAEELVRLANEGGGRDNISVVIVHIVESDGADGLRQQSGDNRVVNVIHGSDRASGNGGAAAPAAPDAKAAGKGKNKNKAVVPPPSAPVAAAAATDVTGGAPGVPAARSRFTWRVVAFLVAFLAIIGIGLWVISYMATNTYFVKFDSAGHVVIYQGRPGGMLWYEPTVAEATDLDRTTVPARFVAELEQGKDEPSLAEAQAFVANIRREQAADGGSATGGIAGGLGGDTSTTTVRPTTTVVPTTSVTEPPPTPAP